MTVIRESVSVRSIAVAIRCRMMTGRQAPAEIAVCPGVLDDWKAHPPNSRLITVTDSGRVAVAGVLIVANHRLRRWEFRLVYRMK